jgi:hypothetical protein
MYSEATAYIVELLAVVQEVAWMRYKHDVRLSACTIAPARRSTVPVLPSRAGHDFAVPERHHLYGSLHLMVQPWSWIERRTAACSCDILVLPSWI